MGETLTSRVVVELEVRAPSQQAGRQRFRPLGLHQADLGLLKPTGACRSMHSEEPSPLEGSRPRPGPAAQSLPAEESSPPTAPVPGPSTSGATLCGPDVTSILTALGGVTPRGGSSGPLLWGLCCLQKAHMFWTDQCGAPKPPLWLSCVTARQDLPLGRARGRWRKEQTKDARPQAGSPAGQAQQDGPARPSTLPGSPTAALHPPAHGLAHRASGTALTPGHADQQDLSA